MTTLVVVIIILLAVLSTPLSLKKLIDRSKSKNGDLFGTSDIKKWASDSAGSGDAEDVEDEKEN